jgi:hypothetical protein
MATLQGEPCLGELHPYVRSMIEPSPGY